MSEPQINNAKTNNGNNANNKKPPSSKNKKKGGPINIFKVALHILKNKKEEGAKPTKNNTSVLSESTNTALTEIMGSVRPLYLQSSIGEMSLDRYETSPYQPTSDASSSTSRSSSRSSSHIGGMSSKYASAQSLYDLDNHDDDEDNNDIDDGDAYYDGLVGDELIDTKAELFIASFYQQMRLQN